MSTNEEVVAKMQELNARMARLPIGQANGEYDVLEVEYDKLCQQLQEVRGK